MLSRLGVIGDVHCESKTLGRVLDALETMGVDAILCVGDLVDGPGDADSTLAMLEARGVQCVAGNHERWFLDGEKRSVDNATHEINEVSRTFIESLPRGRRYATPSGTALLCHGVGDDDEAWLKPGTRGYALQDIPTLRELMLDENIQFMIGGHTQPQLRADLHGVGLWRDARWVLFGRGGEHGRADRGGRATHAGTR
ncbi:MAG: metallophosphoesterase [Deltaproteobacteria bacterium]|nr:metallophosphoesterase [Deltaproteobacteria bacterium]